jgi:hypothetical protein
MLVPEYLVSSRDIGQVIGSIWIFAALYDPASSRSARKATLTLLPGLSATYRQYYAPYS